MRIAVLGSFRKHWDGVAAVADRFRSLGCEVLSPAGAPANPSDPFVRLDSGGDATPQEIVYGVLAAVDQADLVYFYNPGGYLGASASVELGYCVAAGKRFCLLAEPADEGHAAYAGGRVATPEKAVEAWQGLPFNERLSDRASLPALQRYVAEMVIHRGFEGEKPRDVMLLMVEEIGELAKALRKRVGLKVDMARAESYGALGDEMADVLLYLLALANATGVDLAGAVRAKEAQNERRVWQG